jgi:hypothetical protein
MVGDESHAGISESKTDRGLQKCRRRPIQEVYPKRIKTGRIVNSSRAEA